LVNGRFGGEWKGGIFCEIINNKRLGGMEAWRHGNAEGMSCRSPEESNICSNQGGKGSTPLPLMVFPDVKMSHREGFGESLAARIQFYCIFTILTRSNISNEH
jgi:hypothetical protein